MVWLKRAGLYLLATGSCVVMTPYSASATGSVMLVWNPSTSTNVVGYKIYYGLGSGIYSVTNYVADSTNATITGLNEGTTYYFAAKAVNTLGDQSPFSNETTYSVPQPSVPLAFPTLSPLSSLTMNENAGLQTVNLSGITSGAANEVQTLSVTAVSSNPGLIPNPAVNYASPSATGALSFTPVPGNFGTATITVTVNDNGASNNVVTRSFTVTVNAVNQPPTLNALSNLATSENAGLQTVNLSGITSGAANESQTLTVTAVSSNPGLIPNPAVNYASPSATGALSFTPVPGNFGTATITVTVNDNGASNNVVTRSFAVTVNAVNQPPTLNALSNLTTSENAGLQTVKLSGITSGAANESQTLTVTAVSSNPSLIPNPTINYMSPNTTGTLSFTPASSGYGTATITVTVNDNGASNNIATQSFTVTVNAPSQSPTLDPLNNLIILVSSGKQTVNLTGISSGLTNATPPVTVTATSSFTSLIPTPIVSYSSPNGYGTLTLAPVAGVIGTSVISVTVNNGAVSNNLFTRQFNVSVVTAYSAGKVASSVAAVSPPSSGQFALTVDGVTGCNYVVQVSTNMASWTSVLTNIAPFTFVDTNAGKFKQRFYRSFYSP